MSVIKKIGVRQKRKFQFIQSKLQHVVALVDIKLCDDPSQKAVELRAKRSSLIAVNVERPGKPFSVAKLFQMLAIGCQIHSLACSPYRVRAPNGSCIPVPHSLKPSDVQPERS